MFSNKQENSLILDIKYLLKVPFWNIILIKIYGIKIFDLGKRIFATNGKFLLNYLDYLIMINDVDTMRTVIQSSDANFTKEIGNLQEKLKLTNLNL